MEVWKKRIKTILALAFTGAVFLVLLSGMVSTFFFPEDVNYLESRYANKLAPFSLEGYMNGSFQQSMDDAMGDQVDLAPLMKAAYNRLNSELSLALLEPAMSSAETKGKYFDLDHASVIDGCWLVERPHADVKCSDMDEAIADYNKLFKAWPEQEFYFYYVEWATDIDLSTGEKPGYADYLFDKLELPEENLAALSVDSLEEYKEIFFRTDHHWRNTGSYRGYLEVLELLGCDDEPIKPIAEHTFPGKFQGSKAKGDLSAFSESFTAYQFELPPMDCRVDELPCPAYGAQDYFISNMRSVRSYNEFYGDEVAEVIYSTDRPERENLLILADSYDNAILSLLATHFNTTVSIDPRVYPVFLHRSFSIDYYINEYDIDKVLFMGNFGSLANRVFSLGVS